MNTVDPAWFYSSIAQSSAAIVGLIGAILASKMIDHLAFMRGQRLELNGILHGVLIQINNRVNHWKGYKEFLDKEIMADEDTLKNGHEKRAIRQDRTWNAIFGVSTIDVASHLARLEEDKKDLHVVLEAYSYLEGDTRVLDVADYITRLNSAAGVLQETPKGMLLEDVEVLQKLLDDIAIFNSKLLPRAFVVIILLLGWLAFTGVLWPLSALPGLPNPYYSKLLILGALCIGLVGLLVFYLFILIELKRIGKLQWPKT